MSKLSKRIERLESISNVDCIDTPEELEMKFMNHTYNPIRISQIAERERDGCLTDEDLTIINEANKHIKLHHDEGGALFYCRVVLRVLEEI